MGGGPEGAEMLAWSPFASVSSGERSGGPERGITRWKGLLLAGLNSKHPTRTTISRDTPPKGQAFHMQPCLSWSSLARFGGSLKKSSSGGIPRWLSSLVPAFGPGRSPGVLGSSPTSGSRHGACFSLCLCLCLPLSLCVSL